MHDDQFEKFRRETAEDVPDPTPADHVAHLAMEVQRLLRTRDKIDQERERMGFAREKVASELAQARMTLREQIAALDPEEHSAKAAVVADRPEARRA